MYFFHLILELMLCIRHPPQPLPPHYCPCPTTCIRQPSFMILNQKIPHIDNRIHFLEKTAAHHLGNPRGPLIPPRGVQKIFSPWKTFTCGPSSSFHTKKNNPKYYSYNGYFERICCPSPWQPLGPPVTPWGAQEIYSHWKTYTCRLSLWFHTKKTQSVALTIDILEKICCPSSWRPLGPPNSSLGAPESIFSLENKYPQPILMIPNQKSPKHCSYFG